MDAAFAVNRHPADLLSYPLATKYELGNSDTHAELFARLGALLRSDPALMLRELPTSYEAFNALFGITQFGADSFVLATVPAGSTRGERAGGEERSGAGVDGRAGQGNNRPSADQRLDALRDAAARIFEADRQGIAVAGRLGARSQQTETTPSPREDDAGNVALFDLSRVGDRIMKMGYQQQPVPRVQAGRKLTGLVKRLDDGKITPAYFESAVRALAQDLDEVVTTKAANSLMRERERGADIVREKLLRARRQGELDPDAVELGLWLLDKNPALATNLSVSLVSPKDGAAAGDYNPANEIIRLFKGSENTDTVAHEIMHHAERMMPPEIQKAVRREWAQALAKAIQNGTPEQAQALLHIADSIAGDKTAHQAIVKAILEGPLNYDQHYQLVNPSEFWAVNAARILSERHAADSVLAKAKQWLGELFEKIKGLLGLRSDAPVLRALDAVMNADGSRQSQKMLSDRKLLAASGGMLNTIGQSDGIIRVK